MQERKMSEPTSETIAEMEAKLNKAKKTQMTVMIIFGLIILAWLVLGYWRENIPVFISTVALAIAISFASGAGARKLSADIENLKSDQNLD